MGLLIKKSGYEDAFFVMIVLFTIAIFSLILVKSWDSMKDPLKDTIENTLPSDSNVNISKTFNAVSSTTVLVSNLLPFILIGLFAFVFIGTAIYMNHPIMLFIGILVLGVAIMLGMIYANIYQEISTSDEFSSTNDKLVLQGKFMEFLPFIILLIFIAITGTVIYLKQNTARGSGL